MKVLIAGAGIGGLTTALALQKRGFEAVVFERASRLSTSGAGITLWNDANRVLFELGLENELRTASGPIQHGYVLDHAGRDLARVELARTGEYPVLGISRAKLAKILAHSLSEKTVSYGREVVAFEEFNDKVQLMFSEGETEEGDILIGADGIRSKVRQQLIGDSPRYSGYLGCQGITANPLPSGRSHWFHGVEGQFGLVPVNATEAYWFATTNGPPSAKMEELLPHFENWCQPIPELLQNFDPHRALVTPIYDSPLSRVWGRGRVTLLGDAAQATTPTFGHGACLAISSADSLANHLCSTPEPERALRNYECQRRGPAQEITIGSRVIGDLLHLKPGWICGLRNLVLALTPNFVHQWASDLVEQRAAGRQAARNIMRSQAYGHGQF